MLGMTTGHQHRKTEMDAAIDLVHRYSGSSI